MHLPLGTRHMLTALKRLNEQHPSQWARTPYVVLFACIVSMLVFIAWHTLWSVTWWELQQAQSTTHTLKDTFQKNILHNASLTTLRQQEQFQRDQVAALQGQLPDASNMDVLLMEITQVGIHHGLKFELFKPGSPTTRTHYVALPITIRVTGKYQAIVNFARDLATLSHIVSLHNMQLDTLTKKGSEQAGIRMDAVIQAYRFSTDAHHD